MSCSLLQQDWFEVGYSTDTLRIQRHILTQFHPELAAGAWLACFKVLRLKRWWGGGGGVHLGTINK